MHINNKLLKIHVELNGILINIFNNVLYFKEL